MRITLALILLALAGAAPAADRPNIILIMADDLGWGDVGFNGNRTIRTPHLDEMAAAGLRFTRFYSAAPVCSPTRGAAMTGRHPYRYGIHTANDGHMKPQELTLAELLKKLGYTTGHFGKWHLGTLTKTVVEANRGGPRGVAHYSPPQDNGFDVAFATESKVPTWDPMRKPANDAPGIGWDYLPPEADSEPYGTHYWNERGELVRDNLEGDNSRIIADRAVPFIERAARDGQPFFAVVWFHSPHLPVVAGPEHAALYADYPSYERNYYGCITAMDEQIGRLRQTLRDAGVAGNTVVWFSSDNGPEGQTGKAPGTAGPFRGRKRSLYEGGIRVPALLEWPGRVDAGSETDFPTVTSDYLPTTLATLGIEMPDRRPIDGMSLLPVIDGEMNERPEAIGFESRGQASLTAQRYKLIRTAEDKAFELYDLLADPSEKKDLAKKHKEIVERMSAKLEAWRESCRQSKQNADY